MGCGVSSEWKFRNFHGKWFADSFLSKISKEIDACWIWDGFKNKRGYGMLKTGRKTAYAHRVAWELANGPIDGSLWVLHKCDNPPCCNPDHLFLGTAADNNADRHSKGRTKMPVPVAWYELQRAKTACPQGHPYDSGNTSVSRDGKRSCKECHRQKNRIYMRGYNDRKRRANAQSG